MSSSGTPVYESDYPNDISDFASGDMIHLTNGVKLAIVNTKK